jgi:glucose-1-phosphate cytidylyltransferase
MKVVILCGGLGTRLREETEYRPKPMVPVGGRPILWHIMKTYAAHGHKEFILCLGYKGEVIKDYFRNYNWNTSDITLKLGANPQIQYHSSHDEEDWTVTMIDTGEKTLTGGRLQRVLGYIPEDDFLLTYGDGVTNSDINGSIAQHKRTGALMTMTAVHPSGRFGELDLDDETVTSFNEKPEQDSAYINGGYLVVSKAIGNYLTGDSCTLEREPMEKLAKEGRLHAWKHKGFWQCMDNIREMEMLNALWNAGSAPWKIW